TAPRRSTSSSPIRKPPWRGTAGGYAVTSLRPETVCFLRSEALEGLDSWARSDFRSSLASCPGLACLPGFESFFDVESFGLLEDLAAVSTAGRGTGAADSGAATSSGTTGTGAVTTAGTAATGGAGAGTGPPGRVRPPGREPEEVELETRLTASPPSSGPIAPAPARSASPVNRAASSLLPPPLGARPRRKGFERPAGAETGLAAPGR